MIYIDSIMITTRSLFSKTVTWAISIKELYYEELYAKFGCNRSTYGRGDVEQTDGWTNPNYSMMIQMLTKYCHNFRLAI